MPGERAQRYIDRQIDRCRCIYIYTHTHIHICIYVCVYMRTGDKMTLAIQASTVKQAVD